MINSILYNQYPLLAKGIKDIILEDSIITTCKEVKNTSCLLELFKHAEVEYHLIVVVCYDAKAELLEVISEIKKISKKTRILVIGEYCGPKFLHALFKVGISGVIDTGSNKEELKEAAHQVASGEIFISYNIAKKLIQQNRPNKDG